MKEHKCGLRQTIYELIQNLVPRINSIAELYSMGNEVAANEKIIFLIEDIEALVNGIDMLLKFEQLDLDIWELNEKLNLLLEKLENRDYDFISDLLVYELKPLLEYWSEIVWVKN